MLPEREELATVVVCEDDEPTLELLCDHLSADRYEALPAPSASDALRLCHYKQPDLMLLDLMFPDAAGLDVLREVRTADGATSKFDPELPVIVLSGRGSDHDRVRGLREGADDYIVKPLCSESPLAIPGRANEDEASPPRSPPRRGALQSLPWRSAPIRPRAASGRARSELLDR